MNSNDPKNQLCALQTPNSELNYYFKFPPVTYNPHLTAATQEAVYVQLQADVISQSLRAPSK